MQHNNFFPGCNFSNSDDITDARTGWSLCPVQDTDTVLTNRYGLVDDTLTLLYNDLYLSQVKEALRHTMLVHESVFASQIYELHRLYQKQKELMMELESTRHRKASWINSGFPVHGIHWNRSSISAYQSSHLPPDEENPTQIEENKVKKFEKKVLDLELPAFECGDMHGEVLEAPNFVKEQSLDSGKQLNKLQLDLNEPAKIEEHTDYVFNQSPSPVTSNETGQEANSKNDGRGSVKGSNRMNEAQGFVKCREDYGIDLNMSPLSSDEEITIGKTLETEKPQESSSVSLHGKQSSVEQLVVVQALPYSTSPPIRGSRSRSRKKVKLCPSNKTFHGSDHDPFLSAQATSESQSNEMSMEKGSLSSLSKAKSAKEGTNLGKKKRRKPQMKSSKGQKVVAKKNERIKRKKSRRISLVTEGNYEEVYAAEAILNMSRKSDQETGDYRTPLGRNLLWFAEISSLVAEDYEFETLQMPEKMLKEHETDLRSKPSDNKAVVSSIVLGKKRRSSPPEPIHAFTSSGEEKLGVPWGALKKRKRGSRIPATDFKHMIINKVVLAKLRR